MSSYDGFINNSGQVVGQAFTGYNGPNAYFYSNGVTGIFGLGYFQGLLNNITGISDTGQIVGYNFIIAGFPIGNFVNTAGNEVAVNGPSGSGVGHIAISNDGKIVGAYSTPNSGSGSLDQGFVYDNGAYTTFDVPGTTIISPTGINDAGDIVGTYTDAIGTHGFLATPVSVPEPASITLLTAALAALGLARRRPAA